MDDPAVFYCRPSPNISFALIGQLEEIALFLGDVARDGNSSPLVFESPNGKILELPELAAVRDYLANRDEIPPPSSLNLGTQPFPDELKPILPLLPADLRFHEHLYYVKPAEDMSSILTFVPMQYLDRWMASQDSTRYRYFSQAVRDLLIQDPMLLPNFGGSISSVPPFPRVRAYPKPKTESESFARSASPSRSGTLVICVGFSGLEGQDCVRMPDECTMRGTHVWIIRGGKNVKLEVKITKGSADLKCDGTASIRHVHSGDSTTFDVDGAQARLEITKGRDTPCKYKLTNACTSGAVRL